ncbi:hypothetical protein C7410_115187 [Paraburkholderia silvatlantica]|uniref:Uncharacterized protein n=1 Tax=Paraburkholderia silvatlantica TaxID=321895 RepID=A0A2V4TS30_9BURK|nr:hypothetical protein C7410_115187 [Paraburkholderia silvatlantica]
MSDTTPSTTEPITGDPGQNECGGCGRRIGHVLGHWLRQGFKVGCPHCGFVHEPKGEK